ncbi:MAG: hypothetical protein JW757_02730 [Anaerolineales bacterium]|nr:hypothetical protein [Anaerolineales bacterium]
MFTLFEMCIRYNGDPADFRHGSPITPFFVGEMNKNTVRTEMAEEDLRVYTCPDGFGLWNPRFNTAAGLADEPVRCYQEPVK